LNEVLFVVLGLAVGVAVGAGVTFWAMRRALAAPDTDPPIAVAGAESVAPVEPVHEEAGAEDARAGVGQHSGPDHLPAGRAHAQAGFTQITWR